MTPSGKPGVGLAAAAEDNSSGLGDEGRRITRAPLRITPNFLPQDKRRQTADSLRDSSGRFVADENFDMSSMAWAEFQDWLWRTVKRNVDEGPFEFDIRQWVGSIRKWWSRMLEMDVQAKADLLRLYERGMRGRDAWAGQGVKVDTGVEDEWDSIYVECQDCLSEDSIPTNGARAAAPTRSASFTPLLEASSVGFAFDDYEGKESESEDDDNQESDGVKAESAGNSEGDGDDIIDCAIRGRWSFTDSDDELHFSPQ